ncbi:hypothetical protein LX73_1458 [Fodinibius salinus]|uniref:Uncharacterized protein n=1 Tax=Fodinibius salinus TaxID=860790 RepID=A0A5D3YJR1_9BACT|nr:hypothetical protein LX73_1458 [Fodinibius salinus]
MQSDPTFKEVGYNHVTYDQVTINSEEALVITGSK